MEYSEAVQFLYSLGNEILTAKLGLENINALLKELENPHQRFSSVLVAGTNGKGSVAAFCESILRKAGYRTGLYTSPHLIRIEERIQVSGQMAPAPDFARLTQEVKDAAEKLLQQLAANRTTSGLDRHPTYFEMLTAMAFRYFAEQSVEIAVIEVGLGGKYDATNTVLPSVAIITNVDFDHQKFLGNTLEDIAAEKAGIIKAVPRKGRKLDVVYAGSNPAVDRVIENRCEEMGARLHRVGLDLEAHEHSDCFGFFHVHLERPPGRRLDLQLPLAGRHQVLNALTALRAVELLGEAGFPVSDQQIQEGIARTCWPGRLEMMNLPPQVIMDGAHNVAGARQVADFMKRFLRPEKTVMVFGVMRDKAVRAIGQILFPQARHILLTKPDSARSANPQEIAALFEGSQFSFRCVPFVGAAINQAKEMVPQDGAIMVVGSLFLVGEAKQALQKLRRGE